MNKEGHECHMMIYGQHTYGMVLKYICGTEKNSNSRELKSACLPLSPRLLHFAIVSSSFGGFGER